MGASSVVRVKSPNSGQRDEQNNHNHRPIPRLNVQDIENNNNHIIVNPHERLLTLIDECDLLNNNTTLLTNNYLSVTLSPSQTTTNITTALVKKANALKASTSLFKLNKKSSLNRKIATKAAPEESAVKMHRENSKSPKKQQITKENEKKKKKKEKPKAPRAPNAGAGGGGGGGRRGMSDQEQMMRRPRRNVDTKAEK